jgi:hypothetical protein
VVNGRGLPVKLTALTASQAVRRQSDIEATDATKSFCSEQLIRVRVDWTKEAIFNVAI